MRCRLPLTIAPRCGSRRHFLQGIGALGLAAIVRPTESDSAIAADFCAAGDGKATPLFIPRDSGYLGRLAPRGKLVTLTAGTAGTLPPGVVHGPIAYRAQPEGRHYINPP